MFTLALVFCCPVNSFFFLATRPILRVRVHVLLLILRWGLHFFVGHGGHALTRCYLKRLFRLIESVSHFSFLRFCLLHLLVGAAIFRFVCVLLKSCWLERKKRARTQCGDYLNIVVLCCFSYRKFGNNKLWWGNNERIGDETEEVKLERLMN